MIATLTIGKRRAGIPSERGSIQLSLVGRRIIRIRDIADGVRETEDAEIIARDWQAPCADVPAVAYRVSFFHHFADFT
jgi:hypothetical protein